MIQTFFLVVAALCLLPQISSAAALIAGMVFSLTFRNPFANQTKRLMPWLLQGSVVGLGAAMNLAVVAKVGFQGLGYTVTGILLALLAGAVLGRILKTQSDTSLLLSVGTAICGGSAIAAVAAAIRAKSDEISVSLATVFALNALGLVIFPGLGHAFSLDETQFGLWSALAIHDTSSVVGASLQYGPHALEIATTVKLARALWIVPVTFALGWWHSRKHDHNGAPGSPAPKPKRPWFIAGFLAAAALVTFFPTLAPIGALVANFAKRTLVLTLFLIGSGLSRATLQAVGFRPFIQGIALWVVVASTTLGAILAGLIHG